jgi:hypothetical protein
MASTRKTASAASQKSAAKKIPAPTRAAATTGSTRTPRLQTKKALIVPEILTEILDVTPEQAAEWLKKNVCNRRLTESAVALYARDMTEGRWMLNGEAIQIAVDGTLLNGQHRLWAIVRAGIPVKMLVIFNLPLKTQETMDAGKKRTHTDNLTLRGETHSKALAAIARRVTLWERGDRSFREAVSFGELSETMEKYPELRRSAEIGERVHRSFKPLSPSVLGTSHFLLHQVSAEDTPWFFGAIETGAKLDESSPVLTLRERVRSDRDQGIRVKDVRAIGYIVRAWNAHRRGKPLSRMVHPLGEPIPEIL